MITLPSMLGLIGPKGSPTPPPPASNQLEICNPNAFSVAVGKSGSYVQNTASVCNAVSSPGLDGGGNTGITF
jgi:hypothetical protein